MATAGGSVSASGTNYIDGLLWGAKGITVTLMPAFALKRDPDLRRNFVEICAANQSRRARLWRASCLHPGGLG